MTNFLEMSAFHAVEKTYFISITAGILCPIFQISVLPALQILCQSSALKNLCQPRCIIPPTSSLPLLMWQNKPRPIRIKALKRSLKPFKVPLNCGMTIWAVWQQMLNGVIASPPQGGLLSHNTQAYKRSQTHVQLCTHTHPNNLQHPPSLKTLQLSFTVHVLCSEMHIWFSTFLFVFFFSFFCSVLLWIVRTDFGSEPLPHLNCCPGWKQTNMTIPCTFPFNDLCLFRTQSCQKHHRRQEAEMWRTRINTEGCGLLTWKREVVTHLCVLTMSVWVHTNESFVSP